MFHDYGLLILLLVAIAIGWWLGRRESFNRSVDEPSRSQYYRGLNYLLDEQPDAAIDSFIDSLPVTPETLETHLAVGKLMRRKGEVERAIRIHQNLLSRPSLPRNYLHRAHLELARDYISAGLYDRSESLLKDLIDESREQRDEARRYLMEIYQAEREWQQAIEVGEALLPKRSFLKAPPPVDKRITAALSNYCCELASLALNKNDYNSARKQLRQALAHDRLCVRATLMMADVEYRSQHYRQAIKSLQNVKEQDAAFIPETLDLIQQCYKKIQDRQGYENYLSACLKISSDPRTVMAHIDLVRERDGERAASELLADRLKNQPSLTGLAQLMDLHIGNAEAAKPADKSVEIFQQLKSDLVVQRDLMTALSRSGHAYRCQQCGFSGRQLHWLCLGCKQWSTVKPARAREYE